MHSKTLPQLPGPDSPRPALDLTAYLAVQAHRYATAGPAGTEPPVTPEAAARLALAAVHFARTLIYVCGEPGTASFARADHAAKEILTAWRDANPETWTGFHCWALGMDPAAIERIAQTTRVSGDPLAGEATAPVIVQDPDERPDRPSPADSEGITGMHWDNLGHSGSAA